MQAADRLRMRQETADGYTGKESTQERMRQPWPVGEAVVSSYQENNCVGFHCLQCWASHILLWFSDLNTFVPNKRKIKGGVIVIDWIR